MSEATVIIAATEALFKVLGIADSYQYRDPELIRLIGEKYSEASTKPQGGE